MHSPVTNRRRLDRLVDMRSAATVLFLLVALSTNCQNSRVDTAHSLQLARVYERVLSNGLAVIIHEDPRSSVVALTVWYKAGSRDEPPGLQGLAHVAEHVMFHGSEHANTDTHKLLEKIRADKFDASTGYDRTRFYMTVPSQSLSDALKIEADRMGYTLPVLTTQKVNDSIKEVQREIDRNEQQPEGMVRQHILEKTIPPAHPYAHTPLGQKTGLQHINKQAVSEWIHDYFQPRNAILVLSGGTNHESIMPLIQQEFESISESMITPPAFSPTSLVPDAPSLQELNIAAGNFPRRLYITWNIPGEHSVDSDYLDVLRYLMLSRLNKRLVERDHIANDVSLQLASFELMGQIRLSIQLEEHASCNMARTETDEELYQLLSGQVIKEEEVRKISTDLTANLAEAFGDANSQATIADVLAQSNSVYGNSSAYLDEFTRLASVSPASILAAGRKWMYRDRYELCVYPKDAGHELAQN